MDYISQLKKQFILDLIDFAMSRKDFWFDQQLYLQTRVVAMGAKFATNLANFFMASWKHDAIYGREWLALFLQKIY